MSSLGELARLIRSKNAGPFELTFDIMFEEAPAWSAAKSSRSNMDSYRNR